MPIDRQGPKLVVAFRASPQILDKYSGDLSWCLHPLTGFDVVELDHGGRLSAITKGPHLPVTAGQRQLLPRRLALIGPKKPVNCDLLPRKNLLSA
jgi:hypothetical protein